MCRLLKGGIGDIEVRQLESTPKPTTEPAARWPAVLPVFDLPKSMIAKG